jgi:hypothetical protein
MTTTEHLQRIRAKCVELLEIAESRTSDKWETCSEGVASGGYLHTACDPNDARFIASCAGHAEAGWRATIAAIDALAFIQSTAEPLLEDYCAKQLDAILTAWPEDLL